MKRNKQKIDWDAIEKEISSVMNRNSVDNYLSTPDFMLASLMVESLKVQREFLIARKNWFGPEPVTPEDFGGEL